MLPKFHGLTGEDPHKIIGRLHQDEDISIFPGWSCKRLVVSTIVFFNTGGHMKPMFLEKFFPASKTTTIRKILWDRATF
ncbi:hypothetical protein CR513_04360, partial [Mucuna pruriens]